MDDSINNKNNRATPSNVALDDNINCIISKKPDHVAENCYHLTKAQEVVSLKQNINFVKQNQQLSNNYQRENNINNSARNNYRNNNLLRNKNKNYNNFSNTDNFPNSNRYYN